VEDSLKKNYNIPIRVFNDSFDKIYASTAEASRELNLDASTITKVLKGKSKTIKGYKAEYVKGVDIYEERS